MVRAAGIFIDANPKKRNATSAQGAPLIYTISADGKRYWMQSIQYKDPVDPSLVWFIVTVQKIDCPQGYYTSDCDGELYSDCGCTICTKDYTSAEGSTGCHLCVIGFYDEDSSECEESEISCTSCVLCDPDEPFSCPDVGTQLSNLNLNEGHWRIQDSTLDIRSCPKKDSCVGGRNSSDYCKTGYEGVLCAVSIPCVS